MGTFNTQMTLNGNPSLIPEIASQIESAFKADEFTVDRQDLISGTTDISITKGGLFKAVLGMKTALNVTLKPQGNQIVFNAGVGIFGQQVIPTIISMLFFWPVLLTQIWGIVQQSKLDDKALEIAEKVIRDHGANRVSQPIDNAKKFCIGCGSELPTDALFCPKCGMQQSA